MRIGLHVNTKTVSYLVEKVNVCNFDENGLCVGIDCIE